MIHQECGHGCGFVFNVERDSKGGLFFCQRCGDVSALDEEGIMEPEFIAPDMDAHEPITELKTMLEGLQDKLSENDGAYASLERAIGDLEDAEFYLRAARKEAE